MHIKQLDLYNFRNYERGAVSFVDGINLIYGGNAMGKTNILEAVYMLSSGRSHRLAGNRDIIRFGEDAGKFAARFEAYGRERLCEFAVLADKRKCLR